MGRLEEKSAGMELVMNTIWCRIAETMSNSQLTPMKYDEIYPRVAKSIPNLWVFNTMVETVMLPLVGKLDSMTNDQLAEILNKAMDGQLETDYISEEDREAGLVLFDDLINVYNILKS